MDDDELEPNDKKKKPEDGQKALGGIVKNPNAKNITIPYSVIKLPLIQSINSL